MATSLARSAKLAEDEAKLKQEEEKLMRQGVPPHAIKLYMKKKMLASSKTSVSRRSTSSIQSKQQLSTHSR